jgi:FtsH-binding integral membrane protein
MQFERASRVGAASAQYDMGLRAYMLKIYNYMAIALGLTGVVALGTASSPALMQAIYGTPLQWVVALAPLGIVMFLSFRVMKLSTAAAQAWFWVFAAAMGLSLSSIFMLYTGQSIARVFFITAGVFGSMSLYGYTTKKDLTGMGSFLIMGLWGLIIASLVNMFMHSSALQFAISAIGVLIFTGLTAYDTQKIKHMYYAVGGGNAEVAGKAAIMGALTLYLDFINLMLMLLRFFGDRR